MDEILNRIEFIAQIIALPKNRLEPCLKYIADNFHKSKLLVAPEIYFTKNELNHIKKLNTLDLQKLMFALCVLAKLQNALNKLQVEKMENELAALKEHGRTLKKIYLLEKKIYDKRQYKDMVFDRSKHQIDLFTLADITHLRVYDRQMLLRNLCLMGYVNAIKTVKNNTKAIILQDNFLKTEPTTVEFKIVSEFNPSGDKIYSYYKFINIWSKRILQAEEHYCALCYTSMRKKNNKQKYCVSCSDIERRNQIRTYVRIQRQLVKCKK